MWKGNKCQDTDITVKNTDMGVCYTFNSSDMFIEQSGMNQVLIILHRCNAMNFFFSRSWLWSESHSKYWAVRIYQKQGRRSWSEGTSLVLPVITDDRYILIGMHKRLIMQSNNMFTLVTDAWEWWGATDEGKRDSSFSWTLLFHLGGNHSGKTDVVFNIWCSFIYFSHLCS